MKLVEIRKEKGLSQSALARLAELHPATISQIEHGRLKPYPSQMAKIAKALGWEGDAAELFGDDGDE